MVFWRGGRKCGFRLMYYCKLPLTVKYVKNLIKLKLKVVRTNHKKVSLGSCPPVSVCVCVCVCLSKKISCKWHIMLSIPNLLQRTRSHSLTVPNDVTRQILKSSAVHVQDIEAYLWFYYMLKTTSKEK